MRFRTLTVVEVEPQRLVRIHGDRASIDVFYRFAPAGDATTLTVEADYEAPGHLPGFVKNLLTRSWVERYMRQQLADFKALAEVKVAMTA